MWRIGIFPSLLCILLTLTTGSCDEDAALVCYYATPCMPYREGDDPNSNYDGCSLVDLTSNMLKCKPPGVLFDENIKYEPLDINNQINRYRYHTWNISNVTLIFELDRPVVFQSIRLLYLSNGNDIGSAIVGRPFMYTTNSSTTEPSLYKRIGSSSGQTSNIKYSGFDNEYGSVLHFEFMLQPTKWFFLQAAKIHVNDAGRVYEVTSSPVTQPVEESSTISSSTIPPTSAVTPNGTPSTSTIGAPNYDRVKSEIYIIIGLAVVIAALILVVVSVTVCLLCKTKRIACFTNISEETAAEYEDLPLPLPRPMRDYTNPAYSPMANHIYDTPLEVRQSGELEVIDSEVTREGIPQQCPVTDRDSSTEAPHIESDGISQQSSSSYQDYI